MANSNNSAEIVSMNDARARHRSDGAGLDPSSYRHAGAYLAAVRESLGLSLTDASTKTQIKVEQLAAIEELDLEGLPARAYAIGFVKSYAECLELEAMPIVERFKIDTGLVAAKEIEAEKFDPERAEMDPPESPEMSLWAMAVVIAFVIWCSWQILRPHDVKSIGPFNTDQILQIADPVLAPSTGDVIDARILEEIDPVYPIACAETAALNESVVIGFAITTSGSVSGARVLTSTNGCFETAGLNALRRWKFEPRIKDGISRPAYDQQVEMVFRRP